MAEVHNTHIIAPKTATLLPGSSQGRENPGLTMQGMDFYKVRISWIGLLQISPDFVFSTKTQECL
jgi:hypothetical protein